MVGGSASGSDKKVESGEKKVESGENMALDEWEFDGLRRVELDLDVYDAQRREMEEAYRKSKLENEIPELFGTLSAENMHRASEGHAHAHSHAHSHSHSHGACEGHALSHRAYERSPLHASEGSPSRAQSSSNDDEWNEIVENLSREQSSQSVDMGHHSQFLNLTLPQQNQSERKSQMPASCPICHSTFTRKYEMIRHVKATHLQLRPYPCTRCDKAFSRKSHLRIHLKNVHLKRDIESVRLDELSRILESDRGGQR